MATRRWTLGIMTATLILLCAACNSGSTANVQNPPPPPQQGITIAFQSTPPSSVSIGTTASLTAVVTNDSNNSGVDWSLTCQSGGSACGSLSALHTASAQAITYTPPSSLPGNTAIVNIAGFATADHTKNVLASINVTAFGSTLSGTYVISVQGLQSATGYQLAGAISLDGNGNVTGGQLTVDNLVSGVSSETISVAAGSTYFVGPDGRGTLTVNVSDSSISPLTFNLVYLSSSHLLISQTPNSILIASASGTMDQQASGLSAPTGGYAFVVSGTDFNGAGPAGIGGILNIDGLNSISGTGSIADQNIAGSLTANQTVNGTISNGAPGVFSLTLNFPTITNGTSPMTFTGYMVDQNHISLIESDNGGIGSVAGLAVGQGASTGTFSDASFSGTYVFGALGFDMANGLPNTLTSAATFTADGAGHLTNGYSDTVFQSYFDPFTGLPAQVSGTFTGNFSVTAKGRVSSSFGGFANPNNLFRPVVDFYLAGDGTALVLMNSDTALNFPMLAAAAAYPQSANTSMSGSYGLNLVQQTGSAEFDATAIMTAAPPSLTGTADIGTNVGQGFSGTINSQTCSVSVTGCFNGSFFSGSFQGTNTINSAITFAVDFYPIDSTQGFFVENDLTQQASPQVSFGYYTASTLPPQAASQRVLTRRRK